MNFAENTTAINFRPVNASYYTTISYQTTGNEALVFAAKNTVTSFMFVTGEDSVANHTSNRWTTLSPTLQIKNKSVYINSLIANDTNPSYNFYVNGTSYFNGTTTINSTLTANGLIYQTSNGNTLTLGAQNNSYCHIMSSTLNFYFNKTIEIDGNVLPYTNDSFDLGSTGRYWKNIYSITFHGTLDGNAATTTKFASAQSITLTGDTTGTASSQAGWSIGTTTSKLSRVEHLDTVEKLDGFIEANKLRYATVAGIGGVASDGMIISVPWSSSGWGHQVFLDDSAMVMQHRHRYTKTNSDGSKEQAWSGWATLLDTNNYTGTLDGRYVNVTGDTMTGNLTINNGYGFVTENTVRYGINAMQYFNVSTSTTSGASTGAVNPTNDWYHHIRMNHGNSAGYYVDLAWCFHSFNAYMRRVASGTDHGWKRIWIEGNAVTGAVWNDYAECRQADTKEAGYVLTETGFDNLTKTTKRLQHFAGVSSDTWGFSQGETEKAKTPIAVAGRVLVYTYRNRNNYKPGDCVCAAPGGTVDIMTRKEIIKYPDRIVGTVSCVPKYEEWGGGEGADRDPVKVNGRIWIKVR